MRCFDFRGVAFAMCAIPTACRFPSISFVVEEVSSLAPLAWASSEFDPEESDLHYIYAIRSGE